MRQTLFLFVLCGFLMSSGGVQAADAMNAVAERYVHLVLALGHHDPDYVDAFYGPAEWKTQAEKEKKSLDAIGAEAAELSATLTKKGDAMHCCAPGTPERDLLKLRREYLQKQISALAARVRMLKGEKLKFDDESRALYDAVAPTFPDSHFDQIIAQLEAKIPGKVRAGLAVRCGSATRMAEAVCDSEGKTRYRVSTRDQGMPRPDAGARCASA